MAYLSKDDFTIQISIEHLDAILEQGVISSGLTTTQLLDQATDTAELVIKGYLANVYDIDAEFLLTATDRNKLIIYMTACIAIFILHSTVDFEDIPEFREKRYLDCIEKLKKAQDGAYVISGLTYLGEEDPGKVLNTSIFSRRKFLSFPYTDLTLEDENN